MLTAKQITEDIPQLMEKHTNKQIAEILGVSKWTIEYWIKELRKKGYAVPEKRRRGRPSRI